MNKPRIWLKCKWRGKYLIRCALRSSLPSHALWICGKHRSVYFSCLVLFFLCVCVDSVPKLLYQKPGLCFMPFVVLDKGKKWKSWWDVSHVWREKNMGSKTKNTTHFLPLCLYPPLTKNAYTRAQLYYLKKVRLTKRLICLRSSESRC